MIKLEARDFPIARPLFGEMNDHLAVVAFLAGKASGELFVDDPACPKSALARVNQRFYIAGEASDDAFNLSLEDYFTGVAIPQALQDGRRALVLHYVPGAWEFRMPALLKGLSPFKAQREAYTLKPDKTDWRPLIPEGFEQETVDAGLLHQDHLQNLELLLAEMCSERTSVEEFLEKSYGVYLRRGDEIVGWCLSEYNTGDRCEVGIETLEPYQRRGLGTAMTLALCEIAFSRGITQIGWHCFASNLPSGATARRAGFTKVLDYPVAMAWLLTG